MKFIKMKKKPKQEVLKDKKEISPKTARIAFLAVLICLVISAPIGFLMGRSANVKASSNKEELDRLESKIKSTDKNDLNIFLAERFMEDFIKEYMNKPDNEDDFNKRQNNLKAYMVDKLPAEEFNNIKQKLLDFKLYDFEKQGTAYVAKYYVTYKIEYPVEKERTVKKKVDKKEVEVKEKYKENESKELSVILNIPFVQKDGKSKVTALPYYSKISNLTLDGVKGFNREVNGLEKASESESGKINDFIKEFYAVYTSGDLKQATYMMDSPQVIDGAFEITDSKPEIYKDGKSYVVYDTINLREKDTENQHKEQVIIKITEKNGNFYVKEFKHDFGGNN
ncbi:MULTISPECIES: conjugal transfer protein [Enterococcus]|uniref:conjugal transfer protein n=1 Tax=Enterococcus TaxID=1350 RepID=UPI000A333171|nr:conjugal transfer protein [Enterococcus faecium]EGP0010709.1 conjugal transfer protein [Enterococcus faecium]EGP4929906.1 conjugal transfer protein [Enterococcus faecium]EGP5483117.1 conjugal transfer protein [Enterococcus faecium]MDG4581554.1 conjugal transfer protein [Enterococcus faecium]MDT2316579.1 conjugal transfer protein [Enterococcus faecium]